MKKKKGFTLIELITVIAVLSILVILVTQNIMKIYNESKKKVFMLNSQTIYKYANDKFMSDQLSGIEGITYSSRGENKLDTKIDSEYNVVYEESKMKTFQVSNGEYSVSISAEEVKPNDITNEIIKAKDEEGYVAVNEELIDLTLPTNVTLISTIKTTNSITIVGSATDEESGISKYEFKIDDGNYIDNGIDNTYTFNELTMGNHTIYIRVTNGAGLTSETSIIEEIILLVEPTYMVTPEGWATSKTITITYQERKDVLIYSYSIDEGNTWTEVPTGTTIDVVFNANGTVIGKVSDGINVVTSTQTISQIDKTTPVVSSVVSEASTITFSGFTITRSGNATDADSELATNPYIYQISTDGNLWSTKCTNNTTNCAVTGLNPNTTYYYRICAIDNANNQSCVASKTATTIQAVFTFNYTGSSQTFTVPTSGTYKLEVWGAQGGGTTYGVAGKGGYSIGEVYLEKDTKVYVEVGGAGTNTGVAGYNGGGSTRIPSGGSGGGGGGTDMRIEGNTYKHRFIVAGGGGGGNSSSEIQYGCTAGSGGGTTGGNCANTSGPKGGTQTTGGAAIQNGTPGTFGVGGNGGIDSLRTKGNGAGGGGWYGGGGSGGYNSISGAGCGGGGSGYVWTSSTASSAPSGYLVPITYYLINAQTYAGNTSFPKPSGGNETGHTGNGYAKITME